MRPPYSALTQVMVIRITSREDNLRRLLYMNSPVTFLAYVLAINLLITSNLFTSGKKPITPSLEPLPVVHTAIHNLIARCFVYTLG
jgi:hypothetical protein